MSGRPFLQQISKSIESLGGDEWFFGRIINGDTMAAIAETVGCSRSFLYQWLDLKRDERRAALAEARKLSADALVEDGGKLLDRLAGTHATSSEVSLAISRANRQWRASRFNRELYGEPRAGVEVNVSIGTLHLDALRARGAMKVLEREDVVEAELLEDSEPLQERELPQQSAKHQRLSAPQGHRSRRRRSFELSPPPRRRCRYERRTVVYRFGATARFPANHYL